MRLLTLPAIVLWLSVPCVLPASGFTLVAFGDSTTAPRKGVDPYPELLRREWEAKGEVGIKVVNAGVLGNTTKAGRARFADDVLAQRPDLVIIQFGINDSAVDGWKKPPVTVPRVALADFEANMEFFVVSCLAWGAKVIVMTPNPLQWTPQLKAMYGRPPYDPEDPDGFNVLLRVYAETARKVARRTGAFLIDVMAVHDAWRKESSEVLLMDGIHPNQKGHELTAQLLLELIERERLFPPPAKGEEIHQAIRN